VLFELENGKLIPASDELIMNIDTKHEKIVVDIPEGLLEI
jgi:16S rRNA processing protein RimM